MANDAGKTYELVMETDFAAAHRLREYSGKCEHLHGHNWKVQVRVRSPKLNSLGMVLDFKELKDYVAKVLADLDHRYLNEDVAEFVSANPTTENLARYIYGRLQEQLPAPLRVREVFVWESERCGACYREE